jgi:hypothetical protein
MFGSSQRLSELVPLDIQKSVVLSLSLPPSLLSSTTQELLSISVQLLVHEISTLLFPWTQSFSPYSSGSRSAETRWYTRTDVGLMLGEI